MPSSTSAMLWGRRQRQTRAGKRLLDLGAERMLRHGFDAIRAAQAGGLGIPPRVPR